jgi:SAM-dependent methyltransferase
MPYSKSENWQPLGEAFLDFLNGNMMAAITVRSNVEADVLTKVSAFFRERDLPFLDKIALKKCRGKILDIGAGSGSHSLLLQNKGFDVTAMDVSRKACEVMNKRGIRNVICEDIFNIHNRQFDTLLLLMNGIGIAADLEGLNHLLQHFDKLLREGGQVIFDSTDIAYVTQQSREKATLKPPRDIRYYGEVWYQLEYKGMAGEPYPWLFVDKNTLQGIAVQNGFQVKFLANDEEQYLARLTKIRN